MSLPEIPKPDVEFDDDYVRAGDRYEIGFRPRSPDGISRIGRIIGLADMHTVIFEEGPLDLSEPPVVRKFDLGNPENVRSVFAIKKAPADFVEDIRDGLKWLLKWEIIDSKE